MSVVTQLGYLIAQPGCLGHLTRDFETWEMDYLARAYGYHDPTWTFDYLARCQGQFHPGL